MGRSRKKTAVTNNAAPAVIPPAKLGEKGKRQAEDKMENEVITKKQKKNDVESIRSEAEEKAPIAKVVPPVAIKNDSVAAPLNKNEAARVSSKEHSEQAEHLPSSKSVSSLVAAKASTEDTDVKMVDVVSPKTTFKKADVNSKDMPKTHATPQGECKSDTLFAGNLSFKIEKTDIENFFKDAGRVVDVRFASNHEGKFKGFGHVEFETAEAAQKALALNGKLLLSREVRLDLAREKFSESRDKNSARKGGRPQAHTIFVRGMDRSLGEDEDTDVNIVNSVLPKTSFEQADVKSNDMHTGVKIANSVLPKTSFEQADVKSNDMPQTPATPQGESKSNTLFDGNLSFKIKKTDIENFFKDAGRVVDVRFASDHEGKLKGFGHVEFETAEASQKTSNYESEDESDVSSQEVDDEPQPKKKIKVDTDVKVVDVVSPKTTFKKADVNSKDMPKTHATPQGECKSNTLFAGNLSFKIEKTDIENFFKDAGRVVDVRFASNHEGKFKGFGHVEFETAEAAQKALALNGKLLLSREVRLDLAREKFSESRDKNSARKGGRPQAHTIFVRGMDRSLGEDEHTGVKIANSVLPKTSFEQADVKSNDMPQTPATPQGESKSDTLFDGNLSFKIKKTDIENFFKDADRVVDVRFAYDHEGKLKGFGHVEFETAEASQKALSLNGELLLNLSVRLDLAHDKGSESRNKRSFQKSGQPQDQTVFLRDFDRSLREDEDTDVKIVNSVLPKASFQHADVNSKDMLQTPGTPQGESNSNTLFAGNHSFNIEKTDIENSIKDAGRVVDVSFASDHEGKFKSFGNVEFETAEAAQKALALNGELLLNRVVRLDLARERVSESRDKNSPPKDGRSEMNTVIVRGLNRSLGDDEVRNLLQEHFGACGEITKITFPRYHSIRSSKGFAYIEFTDAESFNQALELDGSKLGYVHVGVKEVKPRGESDSGRGKGRGHRGGRGDQGRGFGRGNRGRGFADLVDAIAQEVVDLINEASLQRSRDRLMISDKP